MAKALLFLSLSAALSMAWLLWDCSGGCLLTPAGVLTRWSSSLAGVLLAAFVFARRNKP